MSRDLMRSAEVKDLVRDAYRNVSPTTDAVARKFYSTEELAQVPLSAIQRALGVANHLRFADIRPGETILDLGCGGGIDTILAAQRTGASGRVIALDFLPEMLDRTAKAAGEAGLTNVETVDGEMEAIPRTGFQRGSDHLQRRHQPVAAKGQSDGGVRPGAASRRAALRL